jgi:hypothetical protein
MVAPAKGINVCNAARLVSQPCEASAAKEAIKRQFVSQHQQCFAIYCVCNTVYSVAV